MKILILTIIVLFISSCNKDKYKDHYAKVVILKTTVINSALKTTTVKYVGTYRTAELDGIYGERGDTVEIKN